MKNNVFRCVLCGRFFSSPLPESSACSDHIYDYNRQREQAEAKLTQPPLDTEKET